jgi:uncharacterized protein YdaL
MSVGSADFLGGPAGIDAGASARPTLVLYDTGGPWGHLGELYAIQVVNLVSHFGPWRAAPVTRYASASTGGHRAIVYVGSSYGEPVPPALLDAVAGGEMPVLWIDENIWQLIERFPFFTERYGWVRGRPDRSTFRAVRYKGAELPRDVEREASALATFRFVDPETVAVVAEAVRDDGSKVPWAVRSRNLTYIAENPFHYTREADRHLVLADLIFDLLAPATPERHRALVRLEDISPLSDPSTLDAVRSELTRRDIPFAISLYPVHREPGAAEVRLCDRPAVVAAIRRLIADGGTLVLHGFTHQLGTSPNPYNGRSGSDFEFFRAELDGEEHVRLTGPADGDSRTWANTRIAAAIGELSCVRLPRPTLFEVPHYAASAAAYAAIADRFAARYDRGLYFSGALAGGVIDHGRSVSQAFPYVVRDVHGSVVIPENLGHHAASGARDGEDVARIVAAARRARIVRDGVGSFFFHPYIGPEPLGAIIDGMQAAGYAFVSPSELEAPGVSSAVGA